METNLHADNVFIDLMGAPQDRIASMLLTVRSYSEELLASLGFELVDMEYLASDDRGILRLYIDRPAGGVILDDCVIVSRQLGALLDVEDIIPFRYALEVSSPGLNRPLKRPKDFLAHCGKKIKIKTRMPVDGRRRFSGVLQEYSEADGSIVLDTDTGCYTLDVANFAKCNLVYEFPEPGK
ncbi:MAG: ribosome maturation factor RimP [Pseudomonadota bacterium]|nr:ribosome maturation factor RimP [Pseudomonadota bacterium]